MRTRELSAPPPGGTRLPAPGGTRWSPVPAGARGRRASGGQLASAGSAWHGPFGFGGVVAAVFWVAESEPVVGQTGQGRGVGGLSAASAFSSESPSEDCEGCPLSFSKHLPQSSLKSAGPS